MSGNTEIRENSSEGMGWMAEANCRFEPPDTMFPSDAVGVEVAKQICANCVVIGPCLDYALRNHIDHGVWGGTSERQRRRILKQHRLSQG